MDIPAVRAGIATNANTIKGLRCFDYMPDSITPPAFYVAEVEITFDRTFGRGLDEFSFACRLLVSRASDRAGQDHLDVYLSGSGTKSIKAAIEVDSELGGSCADSHVTRIAGYGLYEHQGTQFYGAEITVRVIGEGA